MASNSSENYTPNVFIFNWVNDYDTKVNILKNAFEHHNNKVKIFNHLTYNELKETINECKLKIKIIIEQ